MKKKCLITLFMVLLPCFFLPVPVVAQADKQIESIRYLEEEFSEVVQIQLSADITPKIFTIDGNKPRVVLDFVETGYPVEQPQTIGGGDRLVKRIRVGLHNKPIAKTRVVVDLSQETDYSLSRESRASETILFLRLSSNTLAKEEKAQKTVAATKRDIDTDGEKQADQRTSSKEEEKANRPKDKEQIPENVSQTPKAPEVASEQTVPILAPEPEMESADGQEEQSPTVEKSLSGPTKTDLEMTERSAGGQNTSPSPEKENKIEAAMIDEDDEKEQAVQEGPLSKEQEDPLVLQGISYEKSTNGKEMVLFQLSDFGRPVVYSTEENELLVVCDFIGAELGAKVDSFIASQGEYINTITTRRIEEPAKIRVLLELKDAYHYDLKQVFFEENNLFVILISRL